MADTTVVVEGLAFPEGPRWHDGRLYFSDMHAHRVVALDPSSGAVEEIVEVPNQPSGLGWTPDGRLLVVSMTDRRLLRVDPDGLHEVADLSHVAPWHCNDMVVDPGGRAYVGNFGFDLYAQPMTPRRTTIALVTPDGEVTVAADDLGFPNGMVITPDGRTLIVGESFGGCLSAFTIADDGSLTDRREWARVEGVVPDGICLDADGAVWFASPTGNVVVRVAEGGHVLGEVRTHGDAFACMLGGADRRTLFVCTAATSEPGEAARLRSGRIEAVEVDTPGAGLP